MRIFLYLLSILLANIVTARYAPLQLGAFIVPMGTLLVGCTFIFRDLVQERIGKRRTYGVITIALLISALCSYLLGDPVIITLASAISFTISEAFDTEIFSRLKASIGKRVFISGSIGGALDSAVFVILGLSPIGAGFLSWEAIPYAILGQFIFKWILQGIGAILVQKIYNKKGINFKEKEALISG